MGSLLQEGAERTTSRWSPLSDWSRLSYMKSADDALLVGALVLWGVLASGCSAGPAALGLGDCRENSMTCCIKKYPYDPVGACGATAWDIEHAMQSVKAVDEATPEAEDGVDEFANNKDLPE
jgi:hypothetical protein